MLLIVTILCSPWKQRTAKLSTGNTYHFVDQLADKPNGKTFLLLHAFHEAGYRVVVPDMLGYGGTDKPDAPEHYTPKNICQDLAALLDFLGVEKAIVVGHDWGCFMAGRFVLWKSERVEKVVMLSVPFRPPPKQYVSLEAFAAAVPLFGYQIFFADESSTDLIESQEFAYYKEALASGKMTGPLNYYRTTLLRFQEEVELASTFTSIPASLPVLWMGGDHDPIVGPIAVEGMKPFIANLEVVWLQNTGHWVLAEDGQVVAKKVLEFANREEAF
ncbi:alpha beta-hydrolase [Flagelloscypha sp. PMI_526]|nr:alpha beta-hydrolase [Flagelloscypha sp. PMI_526]